ncbi:MAG: septum formation family protein [Rhodoglobus sp.]
MTPPEHSGGSDEQPPEKLIPPPPEKLIEPPPRSTPPHLPSDDTVSAADLATGPLDAADLPTGLLDAADLPTGLLNAADLPTGPLSAEDLPTGPLSAADLPTRRQRRLPAAVDPALEGATEVLGAHSLSTAEPVGESVEHDAVGALFGDDNFVEYEQDRVALTPAIISRVRAPRPPIPRRQLIAIAMASGLVAALALTALFLGGTRIGETMVPAAAATPQPSSTATADPLNGPLPEGTYAWNELGGGECLDPFDNAWQDEFTVVDCGQPHAAQLLLRASFDDAASAPYPESDGLATRTTALCSTDAVINFAVAKTITDLELLASYAPTAKEWDAGQRDYSCFVTRSGGESLTESVTQPLVGDEGTGEAPGETTSGDTSGTD